MPSAVSEGTGDDLARGGDDDMQWRFWSPYGALFALLNLLYMGQSVNDYGQLSAWATALGLSGVSLEGGEARMTKLREELQGFLPPPAAAQGQSTLSTVVQTALCKAFTWGTFDNAATQVTPWDNKLRTGDGVSALHPSLGGGTQTVPLVHKFLFLFSCVNRSQKLRESPATISLLPSTSQIIDTAASQPQFP